jgi:hypothetical protein
LTSFPAYFEVEALRTRLFARLRRHGMACLDRDRLALILKGITLTKSGAGRGWQERHKRALKLSQKKCLKQIARLEQQRADIQAGLAELRKISASAPQPSSTGRSHRGLPSAAWSHSAGSRVRDLLYVYVNWR